jgi:hypothetical protein
MEGMGFHDELFLSEVSFDLFSFTSGSHRPRANVWILNRSPGGDKTSLPENEDEDQIGSTEEKSTRFSNNGVSGDTATPCRRLSFTRTGEWNKIASRSGDH